MGLFDATKNSLLNALLRGTSYPTYTPVYIALLKSAPTSDMDGSDVAAIEATYTGYARVAVTPGTSAFAAASGGVSISDADIAFPQCTASGHDISYWAILDGNAGTDDDTCILFGDLGGSETISTNDFPVILSGYMTIGY